MIRRRVLAALATAGLLLGGVLVVAAGTAQAATPVAAPTAVSTDFDWCEFPEENKDVPSLAKADSAKAVQSILPQVLRCIEVEIVNMCDGRTVVTLTNWAKIDAAWTRLKVEILGVDYTVIGGPDHTPVVITLGPPGIEDVQAYLVFEGEDDGTTWRIEKPVGDPYSWELPKACPTATPSPSVTVSVSPSPVVTVTTTGPLYDNCDEAEAAGVTPINEGEPGYGTHLDGDGDGVACEADEPVATPNLPVTGVAMRSTMFTGGGLLLVAGAVLAFMLYRRRRDERAALSTGSEE